MKTHFPTVPVETALQRTVIPEATDRPRPLVLVVDDEPIITTTLAAILNASGLAAMTAPNAEVAIDTARLIPPELLITDMVMPGMSGLDLAIELRRTIPDCDVILFSGDVSGDDTLDKLHSAGRDFITLLKPVHPADLLQRVFECLVKRGVAATRPKPPCMAGEFAAPLPDSDLRNPRPGSRSSQGLHPRANDSVA